MILKIFKSKFIFAFVALVIITLLFWLEPFINKDSNYILYNNTNVFFNFCFSWIASNKFISLLIALLSVFLQAIWLNTIVVNIDNNTKGTLIPSLVYIILMCSNNDLLSLNGVVVSAFFIIYILQLTFKIYGKEEIYMDIFRISMILSIASLFYFPILLFLVFVWLIMMVYRAFNFRLFLISLVGFVIPYIYVLFVYFWFDKTDVFLQQLLNIFNSLNLHHFDFKIYWNTISKMLSIIYVLSIIGIFRKINSKVIKIRKYNYIVSWLFLISLVIALFFGDSTLISISLLCIPATFFVSDFFLSIKRKWLAELILFAMIAIIFIDKLF